MMRLIAVCFGMLLFSASIVQSNVKTKNGVIVQLRALDTITGLVKDIELTVGDTTVYERLRISVKSCRYPPREY